MKDKDPDQAAREQVIFRGINLFYDLIATSSMSSMLGDTQPQAVDAVRALHQRMLTASDQPLPDYSDIQALKDVDYSAVAQHYGQNDESTADFLRLAHDVTRHSAPLSVSNPNKGPQELMVDQTRQEMMAFMVDNNPNWIEAYQNSDEGQSRRERHMLALALGGHSVGATPVERLLAASGEMIDTMGDMPDTSTQMKSQLLGRTYDDFARKYAFDPSQVFINHSVTETPDGDVTRSRVHFLNCVDNLNPEEMTISTAPGEEPMSRSQLIEAAAQSRWKQGDNDHHVANDMARFSRSVLDFSLPERAMPETEGKHLGMLSDTLEASLSRYAPAEHEAWLNTEVLVVHCEQANPDNAAAIFSQKGLTCGIGDDDHLAVTPTDSAMPRRGIMDADNGTLVTIEYGSTSGLEQALNEQHPDAMVKMDKYTDAAPAEPETPEAVPASGPSPG